MRTAPVSLRPTQTAGARPRPGSTTVPAPRGTPDAAAETGAP
jgi:hypothetical protein